MGMIKEFKEFAMRGNVVDMAVGVVIGGAFGKIVTSLVNDVIMPPIGVLLGGADFKELKYVLQEAVLDAEGAVTTPEVTLNYGAFLQTIIDFLLVALAIFFLIKGINKLSDLKKKEEEAAPAEPAPAPEPSAEEKLLSEIRDLLKNK